MNKKVIKLIIVIIVVFMLLPMITSISQASGIGTSNVILNSTTGSTGRGGSISTGYTVKLVSGSAWGTTISATGLPSDIKVAFSSSGGDPTYTGTMTITVSKDTSPGIYNISIAASGDDPSPSVTYKLNVTNSTVTTPVVPVISNNLPFEIGGGVIAISLILAIFLIFIQMPDKNRLYLLISASVIALIPAIYLAVDNPLLKTSAPLHYGLLILFIILLVVSLIMAFTNKMKDYSMYLYRILGGGMFIIMIADIVFGLPLSSLYSITPYIGWKYLFGFGTTSYSSFYLSLAFSLIMIASALLFSLSIRKQKIGVKKPMTNKNYK